METKQDEVFRFPNRDGIGSTFVRRSDIGVPSLDVNAFEATPEEQSPPAVDAEKPTHVTFDRGDGFLIRVPIPAAKNSAV